MSTPPIVQAGEARMRERWGVPRFGYAANRMMLWVGLRALWLGYVLVWAAAVYFFVCVGKARRGSLSYWKRIAQSSEPPCRRGALWRGWRAYRHMVEFGYLLLDRAIMLTGHAGGGTGAFAMDCVGLEHLRAAVDQNRGALLFTGHFGNAEVSAPYMRRMGLTRPVHLVMYQDAADATERFHTKYRRMLADMNVITTTDPLAAGIKIIRAIKDGDVVAIRADRAMGGRTADAELLGGRVGLPAGPFMAAALSGAPVVSVYTVRLGWRKYRCVISEMRNYDEETGGSREERVERAARDYAGFLQAILRQYPMQWTNFYDFWGTTEVQHEDTKGTKTHEV